MRQSLFRDTIFALSSGALPSGVAVIRVSGPAVRDTVERLTGRLPRPRLASLCSVISTSGEVLDQGLVILFEGPASFTGEDCAEFHVHGGRATVAAILRELGSLEGLRAAEAGEFTKRAFLNGKVDLTAAEALADLIVAETEAQRRLALENAGGRQHQLYEKWRRRLLHGRAMIEAELDFADEGDVPGSVASAVWSDLAKMEQEIINHVDGFRAAEIVRDGFRVVLAGAPNAGKSSLLNALAQREVAIVTDVPGTTRDLVEVALDLAGVKVVVTDTAGIRETDDAVERIGVERAKGAIMRADLVLALAEPGGSEPTESYRNADVPVLRVATKEDLEGSPRAGFDHSISMHSAAGIDELVRAVANAAKAASTSTADILPSRLRHVELLKKGQHHLGAGLEIRDQNLELAAEELRLAENALGRIIGVTDVEDVLGVIFSEFCIGK